MGLLANELCSNEFIRYWADQTNKFVTTKATSLLSARVASVPGDSLPAANRVTQRPNATAPRRAHRDQAAHRRLRQAILLAASQPSVPSLLKLHPAMNTDSIAALL